VSADRHVEAEPRTRRVFFEHHRQRVAGERRIGIGAALGEAGARRLAVERVGQHRGDAVGAGVGKIQEMAVAHGNDPVRSSVRPE
jgi:hypothetical protein